MNPSALPCLTDRPTALGVQRGQKMARSAHAYVRSSTVKFYEWLEAQRAILALWRTQMVSGQHCRQRAWASDGCDGAPGLAKGASTKPVKILGCTLLANGPASSRSWQATKLRIWSIAGDFPAHKYDCFRSTLSPTACDHAGYTMKLFKCQSCGQLLYFENRTCQNCLHRLGYLPRENVLSALEQHGTNWTALAAPGSLYRFCANSAFDVCNWLVSTDSSEQYCIACRHNRVVPDPQQPGNLPCWSKLEVAKHRLFYTLMRLELPLESRGDIGEKGLEHIPAELN